jgi:SAM-dependent methyltransferase
MLIKYLKRQGWVRDVYMLAILYTRRFRWTHFIGIFWYARDYWRLKRGQNDRFRDFRLEPYLDDKTALTPLDPVYFLQDTWAARKIFELKPEHHHDVGSSAKTMGILSQYVPLTMVDIRPLPLELPGLRFVKGSILDLPFEDESIQSLSSLCVIEHIGLGRYGDPLDAHGSEKAAAELARVVRPGGTLLLSVPISASNTVYFNAHRAFTRDYLLHLFEGFELLEERYQYGFELVTTCDPDRGFGTGLFMFRKTAGWGAR